MGNLNGHKAHRVYVNVKDNALHKWGFPTNLPSIQYLQALFTSIKAFFCILVHYVLKGKRLKDARSGFHVKTAPVENGPTFGQNDP